MGIAVSPLKEVLEEYRGPIRVQGVKTAKEGRTTYIYIITNREVTAEEGLEIALPYLLKGIANTYDVHHVTVTHSGDLYLITDDEHEDDLGILYFDVVIDEELPRMEGITEELQHYTLFSLVDNTRREAYIIPKVLLEGEDE
uniref:Uncharacterized protein n=1 Tax=Thermococcus sp. AMT7 TaxID=1197730 RepID=L0BAU0_9EURY|nr:hypothetical protein [Thermococcus sp. AMT7]AFZ84294.1 hypothetical protein a7-6 [Thermococcus sp. AMT7]